MKIENVEADLHKFDEFMQLYGSSTYGKLHTRARRKHITLIRGFLKASDNEISKSRVEAFSSRRSFSRSSGTIDSKL